MAIASLSILIPTFNDLCVKLVDDLRQQAEQAAVDYEIVVADDGSTDASVVSQNSIIGQWPRCRYLRQPENIGRAAVRNLLAREARFAHLLFIDSDMSIVRANFISQYLAASDTAVVYGGYVVEGDAEALSGNLRYRYEKASEHEHTTEMRQRQPYRDFHTSNFLIPRPLMLSHPFNEQFRHYGYEDVLLGKQLRQSRTPIIHIDNPLAFSTFEDNALFIQKTEEGLRTLLQFQSELRGYSRLLTFVEGIHLPLVISIIRCFHRLFGSWERRRLCGPHPSLRLFSLYKLGYFLAATRH